MDKFPIWDASPFTTAEMAKYELSPVRLKGDWIVHNYDRKLNAFILDVLKAGEMVLADKNGTPKYKVSCSNRIGIASSCSVPGAASNAVKDGSTGNTDRPAWMNSESYKNFNKAMDDFMNSLVAILGWILLFVIGLIFLILLGWAIWSIFEAIQNLFRKSNTPAPVPPTDPITATPLRTVVPAQQTTPATAAVPPAPQAPAPATPPVPPTPEPVVPAQPAETAQAPVAPAADSQQPNQTTGRRIHPSAVHFTAGGTGSPHLIQFGRNVSGVQYSHHPDEDGSSTLRIFHRRTN